MIYDRWDVALGRFPFSEINRHKKRPILVLSDTAYCRTHGLVIAVMITSAESARWPTDHPIVDPLEAGLRRPCVVRWKFATLPTALIDDKIGAVSPTERVFLLSSPSKVLPT